MALALQAQLVESVPMSKNDQKVIAWAACFEVHKCHV